MNKNTQIAPSATKNTKFTYCKVIQQNYCHGFEDCSEYDCNSKGLLMSGNCLSSDLKEYRLLGYPTRVIFRRTLVKG